LKDLPFGKNLSYGFETLPLFPKPLLAAGRQRWRASISDGKLPLFL